MLVAMLVHNSVVHDTRVIKSATTLKNAGFDVEIHGISKSGSPDSTFLEPSGIPVYLAAKPTGQAVSVQAYPKSLLGDFITTAVDRTVFWVYSNSKKIPVYILGLCAIVVYALLVYWLLSEGISWFSFLALWGLFAVTISAIQWFRRRGISMLSRISQYCRNLLYASSFGVWARNISYASIARSLVASVNSRPPPDLVHVHDAVGLLAIKDLKARYNCPIVWDAHEIYEDMASLDEARAKLVRSIIRKNVDDIDGFITINESIADFYQRNYTSMPVATVVMNATAASPAADTDNFVYDGRLHDAAGIPRDQRIVLYQGGFGPKRGLHDLIKSAVQYKPGWTLVMMGWGTLEQELRDLAASLESVNDIATTVFLPAAPNAELQNWTAGGTIGLIPYENTGLNHLYCTPNKLWEYPNAGVPIICSNLVEMAKMVEQYGTGKLIPREFTANDIADVINGLTDDDLAEMRENCAKFIKTNNWSHYEPRILALYDSLGITPELS